MEEKKYKMTLRKPCLHACNNGLSNEGYKRVIPQFEFVYRWKHLVIVMWGRMWMLGWRRQ